MKKQRPPRYDYSGCATHTCPALNNEVIKKRYYAILFPDDLQAQTVDAEGRGSCNAQNPSNCWPSYFEVETGERFWRQLIAHQRFIQGLNCSQCESSGADTLTKSPLGSNCGGIACSGYCTQSSDCAGCEPNLNCNSGNCVDSSPILLDISGNGYSLTNAVNGVLFDFNGDGVVRKWSWTAENSDDAWLALDRNGNGTIDSSLELFGNLTPQPAPAAGEKKNGFLALAEYDKPANGGNGDGRIDNRDSIFALLRLWRDANHNGISEPAELRAVHSDIAVFELDYKESKRTDQHGNHFRYKAKVKEAPGAQVGRWAWDVFVKAEIPQA